MTELPFANRISSPYRGPHCEIERQVVVPLVRSLLAAGYSLRVHDGEEYVSGVSRDEDKIFAAMAQTDEDRLHTRREDDPGHQGWVWLIYGNGADVISDYTTNIPESVFDAANEVARRFGG